VNVWTTAFAQVPAERKTRVAGPSERPVIVAWSPEYSIRLPADGRTSRRREAARSLPGGCVAVDLCTRPTDAEVADGGDHEPHRGEWRFPYDVFR
jgi:hypothetical protein